MANLYVSNITNVPTKPNSPATIQGDTRNVPLGVSFIVTILINSISCPFTVLLNVLVIMAVKRRPRLQSNTNILLACLAVTDALTGLTTQPSFILWKTFQLLGMTSFDNIMRVLHNSFLRSVSVCSCLHLMLLTCERLTAIKFTMYYPYVVIKRNIKVAVIAFWIFSIFLEILHIRNQKVIVSVLGGLVLNSCILFISFSYVILYRETRRHRNMIKTQQLPQEEVERFVKENKALKTTVIVVGTVLLCLLPAAITRVLTLAAPFWKPSLFFVLMPWIRTCGMLNSFFNPLIYCWRQQEMRKFVFRFPAAQVVHPAQWKEKTKRKTLKTICEKEVISLQES